LTLLLAQMGADADESQQTLTEDLLLQQVLDRQRTALEAAGQNAPWLRPSLQSDIGTQNLLADLEKRIAQDSFLQQVQREEAQPSAPPLPGAATGEVVSRDWWQVTEAETAGSQVGASCGTTQHPGSSATLDLAGAQLAGAQLLDRSCCSTAVGQPSGPGQLRDR
jgi:hypothetical protein